MLENIRKKIKIRPRYIVLLFSIAILLIGTTIAGSIQSNFGNVNVVEVDFQTAEDGSWIHSTLQVPTYASGSNPLPGVVVIHGSLQSKEWLMGFGIELARRGFVVLTIDANGHGNSEPGSGSGTAALEYIANLPYVDSSSIGLIGHSMGGGISWSAIEDSTVMVNALVLVGAGVRSTANATYPHNMLVATGQFDELSSYPINLSSLEISFNVSSIELNTLYGDFSSGTARRIILPRTNHLFVTIDPIVISETVEWMKNSLKGGAEDEYWLPKENQLYPIFMVGGLIASIGVFLSILPLLAILIDLPYFKDLKNKKKLSEDENIVSTKSYFGLGLLYGGIGFGLYIPLMVIGLLIGSIIVIPQSYGTSILTYFMGVGLISAGILYLILHFRPKIRYNIQFREKQGESHEVLRIITKSALLSLLVIFWLYAWTLLLDVVLALDFRCFLPILNDLTPSRALIAPIYLICFIPYFLVEGIWLMGAMRTEIKKKWMYAQLSCGLKAVFFKCLFYAVLIAIQFGVGYITGIVVLPGMIGYVFLFFYMFTPMFAVAVIITVWSYRISSRYYVGAFLNAFLFSWILASILSTSI